MSVYLHNSFELVSSSINSSCGPPVDVIKARSTSEDIAMGSWSRALPSVRKFCPVGKSINFIRHICEILDLCRGVRVHCLS